MYYKLARPDGWDFWTGNTINYKDKIGKIVRRKDTGNLKLCSNTCLHASQNPEQAFLGRTTIPCSMFLVDGKPYKENGVIIGFKQLRVLEELNPANVFKWRYEEVCYLTNLFTVKPNEITNRLYSRDGESTLEKFRKSQIIIQNTVKNEAQFIVFNVIQNMILKSFWKNKHWSINQGNVWTMIQRTIWIYVGYIFQHTIPQWKIYPYQSIVSLWKSGLVPSSEDEIL